MFYWWERGEYYGRKFELLPLILVRGGENMTTIH